MTKEQAVAFLQGRCVEYSASAIGQSQYACNPSKWLSQGMYDDGPEAWNRAEGNGKTGELSFEGVNFDDEK